MTETQPQKGLDRLRFSPEEVEDAFDVWRYISLSSQIVCLENELFPDPTRFLLPLKVLNPGESDQQVISYHTEKRNLLIGETKTHVTLSPRENLLLLKLYNQKPQPISASELSKVLGRNPDLFTEYKRAVQIPISLLRTNLEKVSPGLKKIIQTVSKKGYNFYSGEELADIPVSPAAEQRVKDILDPQFPPSLHDFIEQIPELEIQLEDLLSKLPLPENYKPNFITLVNTPSNKIQLDISTEVLIGRNIGKNLPQHKIHPFLILYSAGGRGVSSQEFKKLYDSLHPFRSQRYKKIESSSIRTLISETRKALEKTDPRLFGLIENVCHSGTYRLAVEKIMHYDRYSISKTAPELLSFIKPDHKLVSKPKPVRISDPESVTKPIPRPVPEPEPVIISNHESIDLKPKGNIQKNILKAFTDLVSEKPLSNAKGAEITLWEKKFKRLETVARENKIPWVKITYAYIKGHPKSEWRDIFNLIASKLDEIDVELTHQELEALAETLEI